MNDTRSKDVAFPYDPLEQIPGMTKLEYFALHCQAALLSNTALKGDIPKPSYQILFTYLI